MQCKRAISYMPKEEGKRLRLLLNSQSYLLNQRPSRVMLIIEIHIGSRGRFSQLLKPSRTETKSYKEEEKSPTNFGDLKRLNNQKDNLIRDLQKKIEDFENEKLEYLDDRSKLAQLYDMGIIDSSGNFILSDPPDDRENQNKEELMKF